MTTSIKKLFLFIICLLFLPHAITAMKRRHSQAIATQKKKQKTHDTSISFFVIPIAVITNEVSVNLDSSAIIALSSTCSSLNHALNRDFLAGSPDHLKLLSPNHIKHFSKDFYYYTDLLYIYAGKNDQETFDLLWNNQSPNDARIRTDFVKCISKNYAERYKNIWPTLTSLQCLNRPHLLSLPDNIKKQISKKTFAYFSYSLRNNQPQKAHLSLSSPFKVSFINQTLQKTSQDPVFPLYKACLHPSTFFLKLLLEHGADTAALLYYKANILHWLLSHISPIDQLTEKISLILEYHAKQYPDQNTIINAKDHIEVTPLRKLVDRFRANQINLDQLLTIIPILLLHGADPYMQLYANYTVFNCIEKDPDREIITKSLNQKSD